MAINDLTSSAKRSTVIALAVDGLAAHRRQREATLKVDAWGKGNQLADEDSNRRGTKGEGWPYMPPSNSSFEFEDLATRAPAPWGKLIISSLAQTVFMETARLKGMKEGDEMDAVRVLNENNWGARQIPLTRATIGHGAAYVLALPAESPLDGSKSAQVRPKSALRMSAFYDELGDEWPSYAIEVDDFSVEIGRDQMTAVRFIDDQAVYNLWFKGDVDTGGGEDASDWAWAGVDQEHAMGVTPVVQFANLEDLDGNTMGEIQPIIPLLRRIDQDTFDRLVVQRFGAWKIRYIAGLAQPENMSDAAARAAALKLAQQDILIAEDADTKFGTLEETPLTGFIEATDADLRVLAAVTQTPPHHLLGLSSNLQAEALAAAEAGLQRKSLDFRTYNAGSYQQLLRLIARIRDKREEYAASNIEIRYRDTESRSLVQAATALGTMATTLKIPVEMLWGRLPGWSDMDSDRAKQLIEQGGVDQFLAAAEALNAQAGAGDAAPPKQGGAQVQ